MSLAIIMLIAISYALLAVVAVFFQSVWQKLAEEKQMVIAVSVETDTEGVVAEMQPPKPTLRNKTEKLAKSKPVKILAGFAIVLAAIFLGSWMSEEGQPDSLGSGEMLFNGSVIEIKKHKGQDYYDLPKYTTPVEGFPLSLDTGGESVLIIIWERNGNEWTMNTRGPLPYNGRAISNCSIQTFSLFLDKNSRIAKLKGMVATVDMSKRCNPQGGFVRVK